MQYIHVKRLEKYHPGYKDRDLRWAKIFFGMVQGDPDCELIEDEIDWARLIKFILLELQAKRPIPINTRYLMGKGIDVQIRPIELTIKMLHNFIEVVTQDQIKCGLDKDKEKEKEEEEDTPSVVTLQDFEHLWNRYPKKLGKKHAIRHFKATVKTLENLRDINKALDHYLASERVAKNFVQNGSTWFNGWQDWVDFTEDVCPKCKNTGKYMSETNFEIICKCPAGEGKK